MGVILKRKINEAVKTSLDTRIDKNDIISVLKTLYAEEIIAWYQYYIVSKFMCGHERPSIEKMFIDTAKDELDDHANKLLKRIAELGGDISLIADLSNITNLTKCEYMMPQPPYSTIQLLKDNIKAEQCAINNYIELADLTKNKDYTTYCIALDILADEEEHLRELQDFYCDIMGEEYSDDEQPTILTTDEPELILISKEDLQQEYDNNMILKMKRDEF